MIVETFVDVEELYINKTNKYSNKAVDFKVNIFFNKTGQKKKTKLPNGMRTVDVPEKPARWLRVLYVQN